MLFKNITIIDENIEVQDKMYVGIKDDKIDYVSKDKPKDEKAYGEVINGKGKLLMSGFYNNHAHSPMTLLRGYGENLPLDRWLNEKVFPFEEKLTGEAVYYGTLLAMAESLRFGIVSTTDMYYFSEDMIRAIEQSGAKNNISRSITNFGDEDLDKLPAYKEMKSIFEYYDGWCQGRIKVDMSLHAEYTNTKKTMEQLAKYTKEIDAGMHVHLSETKKEHDECKKKYGITPAKLMAETGLFDARTTAAHCIWLEDEDFEILKKYGVTVACNPISNLKLASGVCNVPRLLEEGINVTIGTDSVSSNNNLNFIEEMKMFACTPKMMYNAPWAISPKDAIKAATVNGAIAQGRGDCGLLKQGFKADLILIDINKSWMIPTYDLLTNLVYSAVGTDVILTMVDGNVLYREGKYTGLDMDIVTAQVTKETKKILKKLEESN